VEFPAGSMMAEYRTQEEQMAELDRIVKAT
jgi:hypothetical protein